MSVFIGKKALRKILAGAIALCLLGYGSVYIKGAMEKQVSETVSAEGSWDSAFKVREDFPQEMQPLII